MLNPCGQQWGEGVVWNVHFTNKAYLVKLSMKAGGGSKKSQKWSTWLVHGPYVLSTQLPNNLWQTLSLPHCCPHGLRPFIVTFPSWFQVGFWLKKWNCGLINMLHLQWAYIDISSMYMWDADGPKCSHVVYTPISHHPWRSQVKLSQQCQ